MASVYTFSFVFIAMVTAEFIYTKSVSALSPADGSYVHRMDSVSIPLAQVSDGDLHRYQAQENGTDVRFWLYQKPDGKIATVFDACEICGSVGFYKSGNGVVCKNCAAPINPQSVGTAGGCNPGAAESHADRRRDHHRGGGHCGRRPHVRSNSKRCSCGSSTNPSGGRSGANCSPAPLSRWA